jgi:MraZ protein
MDMFLGEYTHAIDEKGRVAIPAKFRAGLSSGAVVARGIDTCLSLYAKGEWEKLAEKIANMPVAQANARAFARHMLAGAMDVELDRQGRIILPEYLRAYAEVKKDVVVAGLYNRIELWDAARWRTYKAATEKGSDKIAEQLGALGV